MKPYITNAYQNGRYILPYQVEGVEEQKLGETLSNKCITEYAFPEGHTLQENWGFRLYSNDGTCFEFSSATTGIGGWQELGSLNIYYLNKGSIKKNDIHYLSYEINPFHVSKVIKLVYEETNIYAEGGICLESKEGNLIQVTAGISPGSVSVGGLFTELKIHGEIDIKDYLEVPIE